MNNTLSKAELSQLAQFKLLMRQVHQYSVDLSLFVSDQTYAKEVLDLAEDTDQEGLMMLAIEIRSQFGLLQPAKAAPTPAVPTEAVTTAAPILAKTTPAQTHDLTISQSEQDRYKFSLR